MVKKKEEPGDDVTHGTGNPADDSTEVRESPTTGSETADSSEAPEDKMIWRRSLSYKGPFLSKTPHDDITTIEEEPATERVSTEPVTIIDEQSSPNSIDISASAETLDTVARPPVPSIKKKTSESLAVLQQKPKAFQQEKKTIMDEINKANKGGSSGYVSLEDKEPMFVRVQTLTKGQVFGMADLVHDDQPALSLISNGAECMLIKKKFYTDHASQSLLNKVRYETSPYPSQYEMQASLQEYVNWVNQKEVTVKETLLQNKRSKVNVNEARSSLTEVDNLKANYSVKMAGPLHG